MKKPNQNEDMQFLSGGGKLGELIRSKDWSETPLGPMESWPEEVKKHLQAMMYYSENGEETEDRDIKDNTTRSFAEEGNEGKDDNKNIPVNDLFKTYTEAMPQMAFIADVEGNIVYYNQRWYDYVAFQKDTEGWGWKDKPIHHPDDLQRTIDRWNYSLKTGEPYEIEYRLRRHDGEYRWFLGRALPVKDEHGKIEMWLGTNTDIHKQKQFEEAIRETKEKLQQSENKLQAIFRDAPAIIALHEGAEHRYIFSNPLHDKVVGNRLLIGRTLAEAMPELKGQGIFERFDKAYQSGKPVITEELPAFLHLEQDKPPVQKYFRQVLQPWFMDDGIVAGVMSFAYDITELVEARKSAQKSEKDLKQAHELIQSITHRTGDLIAAEDTNFNYLFFNDAYFNEFKKLWGQEIKVGTNMVKAMAPWPEEQQKAKDLWHRALNGESFSIIMEFGPSSEEKHFYDLRFNPLYDSSGNISGAAHIFRDVTDQIKAQKALQESENQFRQLAESLPQLVWITRPDGYHEYFNKRWYEFTGTKPGETYGDLWANLLHPDDYQRTLEKWHHSLGTGEPYNIEYRFRKGNSSSYCWFIGRALPIRNEKGEITRWFGTCTDIHQQKMAEEALRESQERYELVNQATNDIIWDWNLITDQVVWNEVVEAAINRQRKDMPASIASWHQHIHPEDKERIIIGIHHAIEKGAKEWEDEYRFGPMGGPYRIYYDRGLIARDTKGRAYRMVGSMIDLTDRKKAEKEREHLLEEIRSQRNFLETLLDSTRACIAVMKGHQLEYTLVNQAYQNLVPETQIIGRTYREVFPGSFATGSEAIVQKVIKTGKPDNAHGYPVPVPGKPNAAWDHHVVRLPLVEGEEPSALIIAWDTTEHKRLQDRLKQQEEYFRTIANNISQLAWMTDENGWIFWYNKRWFDYTGTTLDEMKGWGWQKVHHPDHVDRVVEKISNAFENGEVWEDTFPLRGKDGTYRWFLSRAVPIQDEKGKVKHWFGTNTDITELREVQKNLLYQKSLLEAQQEVSPLGVLVVSKDGELLTHNNRFLEMWQYDRSMMEENSDEKLLTHAKNQLNDPEMFIKKVLECYEKQKKNHEKLYFKDGRIFERYGSPVTDQEGTYYGYVWFFMDITERENLSRQKDEFMSIASHELKTPVAVMKGYVNMVENLMMVNGNIKEAGLLEKVNNQIIRLTDLINDLLDVTRIEAGKLQFEKVEYDFDVLTREVVDAMQQISSHKLVLNGNTGKKVVGDKYRTGQVIINFLSNAIKYSPKADKVITSISSNEHEVMLKVRDFGMGIKKEDAVKVFDRFYRVRETGHKASGLGLGLFISSEIVKRQNGKIWVESEEGKGSEFGFSLPV